MNAHTHTPLEPSVEIKLFIAFIFSFQAYFPITIRPSNPSMHIVCGDFIFRSKTIQREFQWSIFVCTFNLFFHISCLYVLFCTLSQIHVTVCTFTVASFRSIQHNHMHGRNFVRISTMGIMCSHRIDYRYYFIIVIIIISDTNTQYIIINSAACILLASLPSKSTIQYFAI